MTRDWWSVMTPAALRVIHAHVMAHPDVEVGGFIVGTHLQDGKKPRCLAAIEADAARGDLTRLTFTHDAWEHAHARIEADHPDSVIVGWYHSHPGHGIFLSGHDRFIHRHFFPAHYQLAVVVDPLHRAEGLFAWVGDEIEELSVRGLDEPWETKNASFPTAFTRRAGVTPPPVERSRLVVEFEEPASASAPTQTSAPTPAPAPTQPADEVGVRLAKPDSAPLLLQPRPDPAAPSSGAVETDPHLGEASFPHDALMRPAGPEHHAFTGYLIPVMAGFGFGVLTAFGFGFVY